ncbi:MAG: hypothetical protein CMH57_03270 [Myxococcales bacterium]|nr:hypothetical protein [Myxococcales bacterium]
MPSRTALGLLALLLLAPACGDEDAEDAASNSTTSNSTAATSDTTQSGCAADDACPEGQICEAQACVEGCREHNDCAGVTICYEGRCVGCRGDEDCSLNTVCEQDACVAGCRGDDGCEPGSICEAELCVAGCRDDGGCQEGQICEGERCEAGCRTDDACGADQICEDQACVTGCRDDDACAPGAICDAQSCVEGCRDDAGCESGRLCLEQRCVLAGVGCRTDDDCNPGDVCDAEAARCEVGDAPCMPDALEGQEPFALTDEEVIGLTSCPMDTDTFTVQLQADDQATVRILTATPGALLVSAEDSDQDPVAQPEMIDQGLRLTWTAAATGEFTVHVRGATEEARATYAISRTITAPQQCVDTTLYPDDDDDGFGIDEGSIEACLMDGEQRAGFAASSGDCGPDDAWRNPDASEICGDNLDDDCVDGDAPCPTSRPGVQVPDWSCEDDSPPSNVYAWARFSNGEGYFQDGGCFVFFEGVPGEFYVKHNMARANTSPDCELRNGCTCPSLNGWPSYDRRMYAFTLQGEVDACEGIRLVDHAGEEQTVSNACRKYLYQMHFYDIPFSYVATGRDVMDRRLELFPTVEVASAEDSPHRNLPFQSLLNTPIVRHEGFQPME